jgi:hypothetical protein
MAKVVYFIPAKKFVKRINNRVDNLITSCPKCEFDLMTATVEPKKRSIPKFKDMPEWNRLADTVNKLTSKKPIHSLPEKIEYGEDVVNVADPIVDKINSIIDWLQAEKEL